MNRAEEVQKSCDAIPSLVVACHCGGDCPNRPTDEGTRVLKSAIQCLENGLQFIMGDVEAGRNNAAIEATVDVLERVERLDCEACDRCSEFSSYRCETCSGLAGERHTLASIAADEPIYYSSCVDCLVYVANGELPGECS